MSWYELVWLFYVSDKLYINLGLCPPIGMCSEAWDFMTPFPFLPCNCSLSWACYTVNSQQMWPAYVSNTWPSFTSGIIYCFSQKDSEQVTISLQKLGVRAGTYHANMEPEDRTKVHTQWSANELQVSICSLGKPDLPLKYVNDLTNWPNINTF